MREALYRGLPKLLYCDSTYVEGSLLVFPNTGRAEILRWNDADLDFDQIEVRPDTVGQFTGFYDKNRVKIFEGDIVYISADDEVGEIEWDDDEAKFVIRIDNIIHGFSGYWGTDLEVIGSVTLK